MRIYKIRKNKFKTFKRVLFWVIVVVAGLVGFGWLSDNYFRGEWIMVGFLWGMFVGWYLKERERYKPKWRKEAKI